jgi:hypothetical protein
MNYRLGKFMGQRVTPGELVVEMVQYTYLFFRNIGYALLSAINNSPINMVTKW